jgi:hypothetical protein
LNGVLLADAELRQCHLGASDDCASKHDVWASHAHAHVWPMHTKPDDDGDVWSDDSKWMHDSSAQRLYDTCAKRMRNAIYAYETKF